MRRTLTLVFMTCFVFALHVSAQIDGYYRIKNVSGLNGQSYLNVNTNILNPAMTSDEAATDASSVFHLKTGENMATGRNAKPLYQVESLAVAFRRQKRDSVSLVVRNSLSNKNIPGS